MHQILCAFSLILLDSLDEYQEMKTKAHFIADSEMRLQKEVSFQYWSRTMIMSLFTVASIIPSGGLELASLKENRM